MRNKYWLWSDLLTINGTLMGCMAIILASVGALFYVYRSVDMLKAQLTFEQQQSEEIDQATKALADSTLLQHQQRLPSIPFLSTQSGSNRFRWLNHFDAIRKKLSLDDLNIQIQPQQPISNLLLPKERLYKKQFYQSLMTFEGSIDHEKTAVAFLKALKEIPETVVLVDGCRLQKKAPSNTGDEPKPLFLSCSARLVYLLTP